MAPSPPRLVADVLAARLRTDPGRPLVTFYDDASGERVELSVATYANWVAKTASLLADELGAERGQTIRLDLPTHWLGPVFLGAAWLVGLVLTEEDGPDVVVTGPDGLTRWAGHPLALACALRPLGVPFATAPPGFVDVGREVWSQPDAFVPSDPPGPDDPALTDPPLDQAGLVARGYDVPLVERGGRLLTDLDPVTPAGLDTFLGPLVAGGSTIWVAHPDPLGWAHRAETERATEVLRSGS